MGSRYQELPTLWPLDAKPRQGALDHCIIPQLSINPLQTVSLPGHGPGDVSTMLRQNRFLSSHPNFDRPVYQDFMIITAGDMPTPAKIGPDNSG